MASLSATHDLEESVLPRTFVHSRDISTVSSTTHTSTTLHSQPYEPMLRPITQASGEDCEAASQQPRNSDRVPTLPRWSRSDMNSRTSIHDEKGVFLGNDSPRKYVLLRWSKNFLQIVMNAWALYCTIRYLWGFTIYESITGQAASLALAMSTGLSFAFAACASFLYLAQTNLLVNGFSVHALVSLRSTLHYLSSCCLFAPSLVNFVLILLWRKTSDLELQIRHRCRLDADLVWSIGYSLCNHKIRNWGIWVTLSVMRLVVTSVFVIAFHYVVSSSQFIPVRRHQKSRYLKSKKSHTRLDSCHTPLMAENSSTSIAISHLSRDQNLVHQSPDPTSPDKLSPRNRLRPSSRSSVSSVVGDQAPSYDNQDFIPMNFNDRESDREMIGFADRFRALISQLTRETEEALAFARSDGSSERTLDSSSSPPASLKEPVETDIEHRYHSQFLDTEDDFYASRVAPYHHEPHLEDEHIRMLNGFVRRMPTIESVGSREWRSSLGTSSQITNRDRERSSSSRPPTRGPRLSWAETELSGSSGDAHSRSNSLTARAELLVGMFGKANSSEVDELMRRGETIRMVDGNLVDDDDSEALGDGCASTASGSKDSYYTPSIGRSLNSLKIETTDAAQSPLFIPSKDKSQEVEPTSRGS